jgi:hypothetical protein
LPCERLIPLTANRTVLSPFWAAAAGNHGSNGSPDRYFLLWRVLCSTPIVTRRILKRKRPLLTRKRLFLFAAACLLLFAIVLFGRHVIARKAIESGFAEVTGFPLQIHSVHISPFLSRFEANGVRLFNPPGYPPTVFAEIPRVYVDYEFGSLFRRKRHITWMNLHIEQLVIIKNPDGRYNYEQLRGISSTNDPAASGGFHIDALHVQLDSITIRDCSGPKPRERTRKLRVNETLFDVDQDTEVNRLILLAVLRKVRFTDAALHRDIVKSTFSQIIHAAGNFLSKLLPIARKEE